jgi:hypothetical protein
VRFTVTTSASSLWEGSTLRVQWRTVGVALPDQEHDTWILKAVEAAFEKHEVRRSPGLTEPWQMAHAGAMWTRFSLDCVLAVLLKDMDSQCVRLSADGLALAAGSQQLSVR